MPLETSLTTVRKILTRTSGYLETVTSHSLQPYRGCTFGNSLCGVGCYVQHNRYLTQGRAWGSFLEARTNAAESYREHVERERAWARRQRESFRIFLSSATDPFVPQERKLGITRAVLEAMLEQPPDGLVLQTHSPAVAEYSALLSQLAAICNLRVHVSIESDQDRLPGLPAPAASVARRFEAASRLRAQGLFVVITVSPLLPIADPPAFFERIAGAADAVVLDHFIGGDGSPTGWRTQRTALPGAMAKVDPGTVDLDCLERMTDVARTRMPGRVGVGIEGFAGRYN